MQEFLPPRRLLLGPGPSMVHPRVLRAMATPLLGHLDPAFLSVMVDIQTLLRHLFRTSNRFTIALSGTGSAGMEASIVNIVEPGSPRSWSAAAAKRSAWMRTGGRVSSRRPSKRH
jgi:alanine-glyoxylate transaminase / serine-glyoxylate transaminase / serine-pyruvate transaminase